MKKINLFLIISMISSLAFSQKDSQPRLLKAVGGVESAGYGASARSSLSLDGGYKTSDPCLKRVADQIKASSNSNDFKKINESIGSKLAKMDKDCKYFRYELIEFMQPGGGGGIDTEPRFTYRCYKTADIKFPRERVAQAPIVRINADGFSQDEMESSCDALVIAKQLDKNLTKALKDGSYKAKTVDDEKTPSKNKSQPNQKVKTNN